ncbi:MAG: PAS domain-containing protein, partial [Gemmatimonadota bacterium]
MSRRAVEVIGVRHTAGVYAIDREGRCTFANRESVRLLGYDDASELLGRNMHALVHHTRLDGTTYPEDECGIFRA